MKKLRRSLKKILFMLNKRLMTKIRYRYYQGVKLDLKNPKTYNEKLQWMKFNYHDELMVRCTDKYLVREYLEVNGYGQLLNELYAVYDKAEDIDFDKLPDSFVIKANHGSGMIIIVNDKKELDISRTLKILNEWLKTDYYWLNLDWYYKDIKPKIIIERNLCNEDGNTPVDYKFFCFDGTPEIIKVDTDRYTDHVINYYDLEWKFKDHLSTLSDKNKLIEKPDNLEEMIEVSRELSRGFPHVRVDLYSVDHKIIFGELTFAQGSGLDRLTPEYDLELGNLFVLPESKHPV